MLIYILFFSIYILASENKDDIKQIHNKRSKMDITFMKNLEPSNQQEKSRISDEEDINNCVEIRIESNLVKKFESELSYENLIEDCDNSQLLQVSQLIEKIESKSLQSLNNEHISSQINFLIGLQNKLIMISKTCKQKQQEKNIEKDFNKLNDDQTLILQGRFKQIDNNTINQMKNNQQSVFNETYIEALDQNLTRNFINLTDKLMNKLDIGYDKQFQQQIQNKYQKVMEDILVNAHKNQNQFQNQITSDAEFFLKKLTSYSQQILQNNSFSDQIKNKQIDQVNNLVAEIKENLQQQIKQTLVSNYEQTLNLRQKEDSTRSEQQNQFINKLAFSIQRLESFLDKKLIDNDLMNDQVTQQLIFNDQNQKDYKNQLENQQKTIQKQILTRFDDLDKKINLVQLQIPQYEAMNKNFQIDQIEKQKQQENFTLSMQNQFLNLSQTEDQKLSLILEETRLNNEINKGLIKKVNVIDSQIDQMKQKLNVFDQLKFRQDNDLQDIDNTLKELKNFNNSTLNKKMEDIDKLLQSLTLDKVNVSKQEGNSKKVTESMQNIENMLQNQQKMIENGNQQNLNIQKNKELDDSNVQQKYDKIKILQQNQSKKIEDKVILNQQQYQNATKTSQIINQSINKTQNNVLNVEKIINFDDVRNLLTIISNQIDFQHQNTTIEDKYKIIDKQIDDFNLEFKNDIFKENLKLFYKEIIQKKNNKLEEYITKLKLYQSQLENSQRKTEKLQDSKAQKQKDEFSKQENDKYFKLINDLTTNNEFDSKTFSDQLIYEDNNLTSDKQDKQIGNQNNQYEVNNLKQNNKKNTLQTFKFSQVESSKNKKSQYDDYDEYKRSMQMKMGGINVIPPEMMEIMPSQEELTRPNPQLQNAVQKSEHQEIIQNNTNLNVIKPQMNQQKSEISKRASSLNNVNSYEAYRSQIDQQRRETEGQTQIQDYKPQQSESFFLDQPEQEEKNEIDPQIHDKSLQNPSLGQSYEAYRQQMELKKQQAEMQEIMGIENTQQNQSFLVNQPQQANQSQNNSQNENKSKINSSSDNIYENYRKKMKENQKQAENIELITNQKSQKISLNNEQNKQLYNLQTNYQQNQDDSADQQSQNLNQNQQENENVQEQQNLQQEIQKKSLNQQKEKKISSYEEYKANQKKKMMEALNQTAQDQIEKHLSTERMSKIQDQNNQNIQNINDDKYQELVDDLVYDDQNSIQDLSEQQNLQELNLSHNSEIKNQTLHENNAEIKEYNSQNNQNDYFEFLKDQSSVIGSNTLEQQNKNKQNQSNQDFVKQNTKPQIDSDQNLSNIHLFFPENGESEQSSSFNYKSNEKNASINKNKVSLNFNDYETQQQPEQGKQIQEKKQQIPQGFQEDFPQRQYGKGQSFMKAEQEDWEGGDEESSWESKAEAGENKVAGGNNEQNQEGNALKNKFSETPIYKYLSELMDTLKDDILKKKYDEIEKTYFGIVEKMEEVFELKQQEKEKLLNIVDNIWGKGTDECGQEILNRLVQINDAISEKAGEMVGDQNKADDISIALKFNFNHIMKEIQLFNKKNSVFNDKNDGFDLIDHEIQKLSEEKYQQSPKKELRLMKNQNSLTKKVQDLMDTYLNPNNNDFDKIQAKLEIQRKDNTKLKLKKNLRKN